MILRFRGVFSTIYTMTINAGYLFAVGVGPLVPFGVFPWILGISISTIYMMTKGRFQQK